MILLEKCNNVLTYPIVHKMIRHHLKFLVLNGPRVGDRIQITMKESEKVKIVEEMLDSHFPDSDVYIGTETRRFKPILRFYLVPLREHPVEDLFMFGSTIPIFAIENDMKYQPIGFSKLFVLHINILSGMQFELPARPSWTVQHLSNLIASMHGNLPLDRRLVIETRVLQLNMTLADSGMENGTHVYVVFHLAHRPHIDLRRFSSLPKRKVRSLQRKNVLDKAVPDVSTTVPGMTVEGICTNMLCDMYQKNVVSNQLTGIFDVTKLDAWCPICNASLIASRFGFVMCTYRVRSMEMGDCVVHLTPWTVVGKVYMIWEVEIRKPEVWKFCQIDVRHPKFDMIVPENVFVKSAPSSEYCPLCLMGIRVPNAVAIDKKSGPQSKTIWTLSEPIMMSCCHSFHAVCIDEWNINVEEGGKYGCPVCRYDSQAPIPLPVEGSSS